MNSNNLVNEINFDDLAHEVWAAAQLVPGEGIEDGVDRILEILKETVGKK